LSKDQQRDEVGVEPTSVDHAIVIIIRSP